MARSKDHIPTLPPKRCEEPNCDRNAARRGMCRMHYQRFRTAAIRLGTWTPLPCGHFGNTEGHRLIGKLGGDKRAENRESLVEAGRIGHAHLIAKHPDFHYLLGRLGVQKRAEYREARTRMVAVQEGHPAVASNACASDHVEGRGDAPATALPDGMTPL